MRFRSWLTLGSLVPFFFVAACSLKGTGSAGEDGVDLGGDVDLDVKALLRELFPDLSTEELEDIARLSLEEVLALKDELEAARESASMFSLDLFQTAEERVSERQKALEPVNDGFPESFEAVGALCLYDEANARGRVQLSGVFEGKSAFHLSQATASLRIDGVARAANLSCLDTDESVDVVFLIDITGSMSNVISSVRDSVVDFVDAIESSGLKGTVSLVTFQDSVGVNTSFQEPSPALGYERSPFFEPVPLDDRAGIEDVRSFVNRLEANLGSDAPENLSGALDFARNGVIGATTSGAANVIGDGKDDPVGTQPFPKLRSDRQVFVAITDIGFHGDSRDATNSSLLAPFVPRDAEVILGSLRQSGSVVHVVDPSWQDGELDPSRPDVDADYWAIHTGGLGEDVVKGYSLVDLELVVVAEEKGLLDITLDRILSTSCTLEFEGQLDADARVELVVESESGTFEQEIRVELF